MTDCVTEHDSEWFEGEFGYVFENPVRIKPVRYTANAGMHKARNIKITYLDSSAKPGLLSRTAKQAKRIAALVIDRFQRSEEPPKRRRTGRVGKATISRRRATGRIRR